MATANKYGVFSSRAIESECLPGYAGGKYFQELAFSKTLMHNGQEGL